jgi:hypothetical protein
VKIKKLTNNPKLKLKMMVSAGLEWPIAKSPVTIQVIFRRSNTESVEFPWIYRPTHLQQTTEVE